MMRAGGGIDAPITDADPALVPPIAEVAQSLLSIAGVARRCADLSDDEETAAMRGNPRC
jgi:hypothetical protein